MKDATLRDVAALAQVSTGTVSKYLNGIPIGEKNREKIKKAVEVLNYMPSPLARNFARGKSFDVLIFIMIERPILVSTWMHELPIIQAMNDVVGNTPYNLRIEIASVDDHESNTRRIEKYVRSKYIDGLVLLSPWEVDDRLILTLDYHAFPYVMISSAKANKKDGGAIDFDNYSPVVEIVRTLYGAGHRHFGMIGGFRHQIHMLQRERGFRDALSTLGITPDERFIRFGDYSLQSGYNLTQDFLNERDFPTAIVCGNDNIAAGSVRAALERGFSVPKDLVVSGFDDSVLSDATLPTITTVHVPSYEIGRVAMSELLKRLSDPLYTIENQTIRSQVLYKGSTGKLPG